MSHVCTTSPQKTQRKAPKHSVTHIKFLVLLLFIFSCSSNEMYQSSKTPEGTSPLLACLPVATKEQYRHNLSLSSEAEEEEEQDDDSDKFVVQNFMVISTLSVTKLLGFVHSF